MRIFGKIDFSGETPTPSPSDVRKKLKVIKNIITAILILGVVVGFFVFTKLYEDWIWFKEDVGYTQVFLTTLFTRIGVFVLYGAVLFLLIFLSVLTIRNALAKSAAGEGGTSSLGIDEELARVLRERKVTVGLAAFSLVISLIVALRFDASRFWLDYLSFVHAGSFNLTDPLFGKDIGFYIFILPLCRSLYAFLFGPLVMLTILSVVIYMFAGLLRVNTIAIWRKDAISGHRVALMHLAFLLLAIFLISAGGWVLNMFHLVYSEHGHVFGAGYVDLTATLPVIKVLIALCLLCGLAALITVVTGQVKWMAYPLVAMFLVYVFGYLVYPNLMQRFVVVPNEFEKEQPYIEREIRYTRYGFGLDKIVEKEYPGTETLTMQNLANNITTIENIRLNDVRPLLTTYAQKQGLRQYYKFLDVDVDRYDINGKYRQVLLTPRELSVKDLDPKAQTFVNTHFKYTHGYGLVASLANEVTPEGLPSYIVKDVPPVAGAESLKITEPRIYYGELDDNDVITNTTMQEFDYPQGDSNVESSYQGTGGVSLTGLNKLVISINHRTIRYYLAGEINKNSKILLNRNISERVTKIAPFLSYDSDPYMVVDQGKLYWIIDAYTQSGYFPYASRINGVNYARNPVKVVVDAYNGKVDFYLIDPQEPIARTYSTIFPGLFKDFSQMPEGLKKHIRYPEYLFNLQANVLRNFHMGNPAVFYNKEDAWDIAKEVFETGKPQPLNPYYTVMKLPDEGKEEFILMLPFTPASKDENPRNNMVAWLAGRSDGEHYGELLLYKLPKGVEVDGPMQIEAKIDQDPEISKALSLWNQRGSSVIRGHLQVIPMDGSFLYVEPIYLQSDKGGIPEMKKVIVSYKDKVVMEDTLQGAFKRIFGGVLPQQAVQPSAGGETQPQQPAAPNNKISDILTEVEKLKQQLSQLEEMLRQLEAGNNQ